MTFHWVALILRKYIIITTLWLYSFFIFRRAILKLLWILYILWFINLYLTFPFFLFNMTFFKLFLWFKIWRKFLHAVFMKFDFFVLINLVIIILRNLCIWKTILLWFRLRVRMVWNISGVTPSFDFAAWFLFFEIGWVLLRHFLIIFNYYNEKYEYASIFYMLLLYNHSF